MPGSSEWSVAPADQPSPEDYEFDLDRVLSAVVGLKANIPPDAFTADVLGTERSGQGVFIEGGVVLTIGYLITEASSIWLSLADGRVVPGHVLGYDQETGFGLVQPLARLDQVGLPLGRSADVKPGDRVVVAGAGGRGHSVAARIVSKQEFAGYWEYVLDEAIFTAPPHPNWGGTAAVDESGAVIGIGSLQLEQSRAGGKSEQLNMIVPIDLLKPVIGQLLAIGKPDRPPRPWLGLYAVEVEDRVVVAGIAGHGPAKRADLRTGDVVLAVGGRNVSGGLAGLFRRIWSLGSAGIEVPLTIDRDGRTLELSVRSGDRNEFLKSPKLH